jgi:glucan phosphoethanolaminetransferase (alkaline phosphatase superfamily)
MFIVNNVIFTIFFVNSKENHAPKNLSAVLTVVLGFLLVPSIFFTGIRCDKNSPWTTLIALYFSLIFSLLIFAMKGNHLFLEIVRSIGFSGSVISVFNIYMLNLIILSKSVSRECRGLMFGICCGVGALGAFVGLTLGQIIHDDISA